MPKINYTFNDMFIKPAYSDINSRSECNLGTTFCGRTYSIPLVPANMSSIAGYDMLKKMSNMGGIGIMHRFNDYLFTLHNLDWDTRYAASIGVNNVDEDIKNIFAVCSPEFITIDVAHGHHIKVAKAIETIKNYNSDIKILAGNIATAKGAFFLANAGADAVKVGVGCGSLCETRIRTGVGTPQLSSIVEVYEAIKGSRFSNVDIMADGGMETPGDAAKAIAAGADMVMSGNFFAGTKETPLHLMKSGDWLNPTLYKQYMGSASYAGKHQNGQETTNIEGNSKLIPYKGTCERIVTEVMNGIRSSMSYVGARTLDEFRRNVEFIAVTPNGTREAKPFLLG